MKKKLPFFILIIFVIDIILSFPCGDKLVCTGLAMKGNIQYLFLWVILLIPLSLLALTLTDQKHKFWLKFSGIFFAISMVIIFMTPEYGSGIVDIDRELTNWFFAGLYTFISLVYFVVQFFKHRKLLSR